MRSNSVSINFESSFRSEATQIASLEVTFDGVLYSNLLTLDGNVLPDGGVAVHDDAGEVGQPRRLAGEGAEGPHLDFQAFLERSMPG